uniref:Alkylated DNA repair protein AlkB homologue 8 N-terminal domain-containing protein n=1 Tax=Knipowitschia caucasica TaxID=637954 RepID=A0AAV2M0I6_KNICA
MDKPSVWRAVASTSDSRRARDPPPSAPHASRPGSAMGYRLYDIHDSVKLIKFADDTTLIGLISNNDESAYRGEVDRLVSWCSGNNLELNAQKTVEMIVDFRKSTVPPPPPSVMDSPITSVESFRFLGTTITQDLKWEPTISSLIKKAQQRMYFLRQLRKAKLPAQMLVQFYTAIIESILTSSITVWFAGATVRDKQRLQRIVRSAEEVIGRSLPSLQDLSGSKGCDLHAETFTSGRLWGEGGVLSAAVPVSVAREESSGTVRISGGQRKFPSGGVEGGWLGGEWSGAVATVASLVSNGPIISLGVFAHGGVTSHRER